MLEQFSAAVGKLYQASTGSVTWREALVALEDVTGAAGAVIDLVPTSANFAPKTLSGSFSEENCEEYSRNYQMICPRIRHATENPVQEAQFDYLFMNEAAMDRDPVYDWFGKHGLRYFVGARISHTPGYFGFVSLQRSRRQGHVTPADVDTFLLLKPHISKAANLAVQLGTLRSEARLGSAVMDRLDQAIFALNRNGQLLSANAAARRLLAANDGLSIDEGRLRADCTDDQKYLDAAILGATTTMTDSSGWARVSRPSGGSPLAVFVSPVSELEDEFLLAPQAAVLVIVHDPARMRCASPTMLTDVYSLTETEAKLASALSGGHSLESASALLHTKVSTARAHLKSVFRKCGVTRQQDLVRLLASLH